MVQAYSVDLVRGLPDQLPPLLRSVLHITLQGPEHPLVPNLQDQILIRDQRRRSGAANRRGSSVRRRTDVGIFGA